MSEPFLSEIRMIGFDFAPRGWAFCDGQLLPISQNQSLYSLLGTTYGGNGRTDFALPDLRGRVPIHKSASDRLGAKGGEEAHALTQAEMPSHSHAILAKTANAQSSAPAGQYLSHTEEETYAPPGNLVSMSTSSVGSTGADGAHENMQPFLAIRFCIALQGLFPPRN